VCGIVCIAGGPGFKKKEAMEKWNAEYSSKVFSKKKAKKNF
jgi:hypothetical protein